MSELKPCPRDPKCTECAVRDARREAGLAMLAKVREAMPAAGLYLADFHDLIDRLEAAAKGESHAPAICECGVLICSGERCGWGGCHGHRCQRCIRLLDAAKGET